ncbi:MAG: GerMN domain-containing protein [Christensenellales bacterium]|jgi:hypothetical protein
MRSGKRRLWLLLVLGLLLNSGCTVYLIEEPANIDIPPMIQNVQTDEILTTLYFPYNDENVMLRLLASDTRKIKIAPNERLDMAVLKDLIKGPSADKDHLIPCINASTQVVSLEVRGDILYVTLSREFLEPMSDFPADWETDALWRELKDARQEMATYAVVNTLLQLGQGYSSVQFLIDRLGSGVGERPTRGELGFVGDANQIQLAEPMARFDDVTLTPEKTTQLVFNYMVNGSWVETYEFVAQGSGKPSYDEAVQQHSIESYAMERFEILDQTSSLDGNSVTVFVSYRMRTHQGSVVEKTNKPIRLVQENELWKFTYDSFKSLFTK